MEAILWDAIEALVSAINNRNYIEQHSIRVAHYAVEIAKALGIQGHALDELRLGALLHDIGHIIYPDDLISKDYNALDEDERKIIESHPHVGVELIEKWSSLDFVKPFILHHQEWIDGSGYPNRISGDAISKEVQIVSIADIYEALRHSRMYRNREGLPHKEVIAIMSKMKGKRWDAELFNIFLEVSQKWEYEKQ